MKQVFLDTVGLIAIWDEQDQWHASAQAAWMELVQTRASLITTSHVLLECGNALARTPFRTSVNDLRLQLEHKNLLVYPTHEDWTSAWQHYLRGGAADAGIVDHISFAVMRRLQVTDAFSNDLHFHAAGFNTLF